MACNTVSPQSAGDKSDFSSNSLAGPQKKDGVYNWNWYNGMNADPSHRLWFAMKPITRKEVS
jgi:hypothetical protein